MKHALSAADLLDKCVTRIRDAIELESGHRQNPLYEMAAALAEAERLLRNHLAQLLEMKLQHPSQQSNYAGTLQDVVDAIRAIANPQNPTEEVVWAKASEQEYLQRNEGNLCDTLPPGQAIHSEVLPRKQPPCPPYNRSRPVQYFRSRSTADTLLFRLNVILQLCLVRIEDAYLIISRRSSNKSTAMALTAWAGCTAWLLTTKPSTRRFNLIAVICASGKAAGVTYTTRLAAKEIHKFWMSSKLAKSTDSVLDWTQQWILVQSVQSARSSGDDSVDSTRGYHDTTSQRLIEYTMNHHHPVSGWGSLSEIRFLFIKRTMDLFYAAVGTAVEVTRGSSDNTKQSNWKMPLATMAAASYYSVAGPTKRASEVVSSQSFELIRSAWGLVSLPSVKQLSLKASRLVKRAAVADRIVIDGVSCFILCRDPFPELAIALRRFHRQQKRSYSNLETIDERPESPGPWMDELSMYTKRNVILHITAGGFFAHTIASDIPFLMDWSARTGAVVICPEYSLLPEHTYPVALNEVTGVYNALVGKEAVSLLDFQVERIVLTGESTGGNLATALCVRLCEQMGQVETRCHEGQDGKHDVNVSESETHVDESLDSDNFQLIPNTRLPDAIMLSCPALNLTMELSPSRVTGESDPVLPKGLLSTISDAYIPPSLGVKKDDPSVSPLYASNGVLQCFPPTLIFASSEGPLLDDSVAFNTRLMRLGLDSDLRAANHMPHAYWGLCTAGFPEARRVQQECQDWLEHQFSRAAAS